MTEVMVHTFEIRQGDALELLRQMPDKSIDCCVTSPPYFNLRDYGAKGQIGLESTPEEYIATLVDVFGEVRRVLKSTGSLWVNIADSYAGGRNGGGGSFANDGIRCALPGTDKNKATRFGPRGAVDGIKPKDLIGIPWMLAFALRADGWYLRQEIIWSKPNPMPESVTDRCTKAHEQIFLLAKSRRYYFDQDAIREPAGGWNGSTFDGPRDLAVRPNTGRKVRIPAGWKTGNGSHGSIHDQGREQEITYTETLSETRNKRSVWEVATQGFSEAHFATFPTKLVEPMILAGCPEGGTVLDPFAGAGTTGVVALRHNRNFIGLELNPEYCEMTRRRILGDAPLLNQEALA